MKIRKAPYPIDFLGNSPEFVLLATPWSTEGRPWRGVFAIHGLPAGTLTVSIDGEDLTWALSDNPGDGLFEMLAAATAAGILDTLEAKLVYNPQLNRDFTARAEIVTDPELTGGEPTVWLTLTAREPGPHSVGVSHSTGTVYTVEVAEGLTQTMRKNWRALAFFSVTTPQGTSRTPDMLFEESGGDVHVPTDIIRAYMPKPDIPGWGEAFTAKPCPNATAKVRLYYGEMYAGTPTTAWMDGTANTAHNVLAVTNTEAEEEGMTLHTLMRSGETTLVNGEVEQYAALNNIPGWEACNDDHLHLKEGADIFGQDNGETTIVPQGAEQYIYMYNYSAADITVRLLVSAVFADGSSDNARQDVTLTLAPGVNRITVKDDDAVAWRASVTDTNFNRTVTRNYTVRAFEHGFHTFLMLNALNLYESMPVEFLAREEQSEGERRIIAGRDSYGSTDRQTVFTARCLPRNASGLKLLRTAFHKQDNLLVEGEHAWYIDMIPGSVTLSDESDFLTECEFKFRLREKVNRNPQVIFTADSDFEDGQVVRTDTVFR